MGGRLGLPGACLGALWRSLGRFGGHVVATLGSLGRLFDEILNFMKSTKKNTGKQVFLEGLRGPGGLGSAKVALDGAIWRVRTAQMASDRASGGDRDSKSGPSEWHYLYGLWKPPESSQT